MHGTPTPPATAAASRSAAAPAALPHPLDLSPDELEAAVAELGHRPFRARQLARWILRQRAATFDEMQNLPAALREQLAARFRFTPPVLLRRTAADDGATIKTLLRLGGDARGDASDGTDATDRADAVEVVRMEYDPDDPGARGRTTVCVSTQVGCAMACIFCATGQQGFTRNLGASEVVQQVLYATDDGAPRPSNVVFMGMGEPLANYDATLTAIRWLTDPRGLDMRARGITVSTVGLVGAIRKLAQQRLQIGLTVSLHAPDDDLRRRLIPTAGGTTLTELLAVSGEYAEVTGRRVTYAYALLDGVNDAPEQGKQLAALLSGRRAHVNLIPYNPTAGPGLRRPSGDRVRAFQRELLAGGVNATVRVERGVEIAAACGQLRTDLLADRARRGDGPGAPITLSQR